MSQVIQIKQTEWTPDQVELVKRTICKGASDDELKLFIHVAQRTGLDPFARQIYAMKRKNNKTNREEMSIQVGIDGFRLIADRTGQYAGSDDPIVDDEKEPNKATVTVYKLMGGQRCPFTATARWSEYYPGDAFGFMWRKMPCLMLGKVAEALALRKAFPAELSGLYTADEMAQAETNVARIVGEQPQPEDGHAPPVSQYRVPSGTYARYSLEELDSKEVLDYIARQEKAIEAGKKVKPAWWDEFVERAEDYYSSLETADSEESS